MLVKIYFSDGNSRRLMARDKIDVINISNLFDAGEIAGWEYLS